MHNFTKSENDLKIELREGVTESSKNWQTTRYMCVCEREREGEGIRDKFSIEEK